jgi:predicted TPR repeat methyltransferase
MNSSKNNLQNKKVAELYDGIANVYDSEFESKAEYQVPSILKDIYRKYNINNGVVLDIGCGTGKLKDYLGSNFSFIGIDISSLMLNEAKKQGYSVFYGDAIEIIKSMDDKSVDHVVALSSLYFIEEFDTLIKNVERVARKSIFITLEQFRSEIIDMMRAKDINLYNHSLSLVSEPTEIINNTFLWKRPNTEDKVYGDIVFKILDK